MTSSACSDPVPHHSLAPAHSPRFWFPHLSSYLSSCHSISEPSSFLLFSSTSISYINIAHVFSHNQLLDSLSSPMTRRGLCSGQFLCLGTTLRCCWIVEANVCCFLIFVFPFVAVWCYRNSLWTWLRLCWARCWSFRFSVSTLWFTTSTGFISGSSIFTTAIFQNAVFAH